MPADLLVDLSNVCRDERLGGGTTPNWERYQRVLGAWRGQINASSQVLAVADESLMRHLEKRADKQAFIAALSSGEAIQVPDADPVLLDEARLTGAAVLSRDGFVGHRRRHDWIQGNAEHFWSWRIVRGDVRVVRRDMKVRNQFTMTSAAEKDERKARGLLRDDADIVLSRLWRCAQVQCERSCDTILGDPPALRRGVAKCPSCGAPAVDMGPRESGRIFKLTSAGTELARFGLLDGSGVTLGRVTSRTEAYRDIATASSQPSKISREHARLELRGGQAVVTDLASRNGTLLERWNPLEHRWDQGSRLDSHQAATMLPRDRVTFPGGIHVEQSAREYVVLER